MSNTMMSVLLTIHSVSCKFGFGRGATKDRLISSYLHFRPAGLLLVGPVRTSRTAAMIRA
jgi:hypothetical protein